MIQLPTTREKYSARWKDTEYWQQFAREVLVEIGIEALELKRPARGTDIVFGLGDSFLKIYSPFWQNDYDNEIVASPALAGLSIPTSRILRHGTLNCGWQYAIISALQGEVIEEVWPQFSDADKQALMAQLGDLAREVQSRPAPHFPHHHKSWEEFIDSQAANALARHTQTKLPEHLLAQVDSFVANNIAAIRTAPRIVLLTGEYTPDNLLATQTKDGWRLSGMFDFGDCMTGHPEYDLLGPTLFFAAGNAALQKPFFDAYYDQEYTLTHNARMHLMTLAVLHQFANFNAQIVMPNWQGAQTFEELAEIVWP